MKRLALLTAVVALAACAQNEETPAADTAAPAPAMTPAPADTGMATDTGMKMDTGMKKDTGSH